MRKFLCFMLFVPVLLNVLWPIAASAQARKGAISGQVTDTSGGVLKGAQVSVDSKGISVVSDVQGQFFIADLDPGSYTVSVTYVGFSPLKKTPKTCRSS
jgi:uncharacterized protein (DUF2141 family)